MSLTRKSRTPSQMFDTSFPRMRSAQAGSERVLVTSERCWPSKALPRLKESQHRVAGLKFAPSAELKNFLG
eukprot:g44593.t1